MKNLIIVGARGLARETIGQIEFMEGYKTEFEVKGFLDDDAHILDDYPGYPPILSSVEDYEIQPDDVFFIALGDSKMRLLYAEKIKQKGGSFISLISKRAHLQSNIRHFGVGCLVDPFCCISSDTYIGDFVIILASAMIGHNATVEEGSTLDAQSFLGGGAHIKKGAYIGTGSKIMPRITIGEFAYVNACSLVAKDVPDATTVMGIPAQPNRKWLRMVLDNTK
jgi:sugar O-acyltransferase (sialic acid O-acetyltransferase NeuD family)